MIECSASERIGAETVESLRHIQGKIADARLLLKQCERDGDADAVELIRRELHELLFQEQLHHVALALCGVRQG